MRENGGWWPRLRARWTRAAALRAALGAGSFPAAATAGVVALGRAAHLSGAAWVFAAGVLAVIWTCFAVIGWHSYRDHVLSLALCDRIDQIVDQAAAAFPDWVERQAGG